MRTSSDPTGLESSHRRWPPLLAGYGAVVLANYAAQVPYTLHLYGTGFSRPGALLLAATLAWFVVALRLFRRGRQSGFWLLLGYAAVQFLFYFDSEVVMAFAGFGLPYHLGRTGDLIVWLAFLIGDLNFVGAGVAVVYLVRYRRALLGR